MPLGLSSARFAGMRIARCNIVERRQPSSRLPRRLLVVDDAATVRLVASALLGGEGRAVETAVDGVEAVSVVAFEGHCIDAVIMDLEMPRVDGFESARQMRLLGYSGALLAITARAGGDTRARCLGAGFDAQLEKPIDRDAILTELAVLCRERPAPGSHGVRC